MSGLADSASFIDRRFDTLYVADERGRIVRTNEWDPRPAPRFHLMRADGVMAARYRFDLSDARVEELEAIIDRERTAPPFGALPHRRDAFRDALAQDAPADRVWAGPEYRFEATAAPSAAVEIIGPGTAQRLAGRFDDWLQDVAHRQPFVAVVEGDRAVAICASVRITDTIHCAGIETHPDFRRRGHAVIAAAAWAHEVRKLGAEPLYSTSWENAASLAVARRLGLRQVATDFHLT